jgi:hypothetical protein
MSYGAVDMFMGGFVSYSELSGQGCPVFLFKEWTLNTKTKYWVAFFGIYLAAVGTEGFIALRRYSQKELKHSEASKEVVFVITMTLYAAHLSMGYFLMLVIMMYQSELFVVTILGLMTGAVQRAVQHAV